MRGKLVQESPLIKWWARIEAGILAAFVDHPRTLRRRREFDSETLRFEVSYDGRLYNCSENSEIALSRNNLRCTEASRCPISSMATCCDPGHVPLP